MNCLQICNISRKRLNQSANIPKSFMGLLFWNTLYIVYDCSSTSIPSAPAPAGGGGRGAWPP